MNRQFSIYIYINLTLAWILLPVNQVVLAQIARGDIPSRYTAQSLHLPLAIMEEEPGKYRGYQGGVEFTREGVSIFLSERNKETVVQNDMLWPTRPEPLRKGKTTTRFVGASRDMRLEPFGLHPGKGQVYLSADSAKWRVGLPLYRGMAYQGVWAGVDIVYSETNGRLESRIILHPGARVTDVRFEVDGGEEEARRAVEGNNRGPRQRAKWAYRTGGEKTIVSLQELDGKRDLIFHRTEFSRYLTAQRGAVDAIHVDEAGCITVLIEHDTLKHYIGRLLCDGISVQFMTLYSNERHSLIAYGSRQLIAVQRDGSSVLAFPAYDLDAIPFTSNAREPTDPSIWHNRGYNCFNNTKAVIQKYSEMGILEYSSLFGFDTTYVLMPSDLAVDAKDNVYICGMISRSPNGNCPARPDRYASHPFACLTPGSWRHEQEAFPWPESECGFLVKLGRTPDSLHWGTMLLDNYISIRLSDIPYTPTLFTGENKELHLEVDDRDRPVVLGTVTGPVIAEAVRNAIHPSFLGGRSEGFLMRFSQDGASLLQGTYLGGSGDEIFTYLRRGRNGELHMGGTTSSLDYPLVNSSTHPSADCSVTGDGMYSILGSDGSLIRSGYLGMSDYDRLLDEAVDEAGNRYLLGVANMDKLSEWNGYCLPGSGAAQILTVLPPQSDSVLMRTSWAGLNYYYPYYTNSPHLQVDRNGYVVFGFLGTKHLPEFHAPVFDPSLLCDSNYFSCPPRAFLTRLYLPFNGQDYPQVEVSGWDSLWQETRTGLLGGTRFPVTVTMRNPDTLRTAHLEGVELVLPPGMRLDPGTQPSIQVPSPAVLAPGGWTHCTWTVRVDSVGVRDSALRITAFAPFTTVGDPPSCPVPFSRGREDVAIHRYRSPEPLLSCAWTVPDTLHALAELDSVDGNPFMARCVLRNVGTEAVNVNAVVVRPLGSLMILPSQDTLRTGRRLGVGDSLVLEWQVKTQVLSRVHESGLGLVLVDTFGVRRDGCEARIVTETVPGLTCGVSLPDTLRYETASGPIPLYLTLENHLDTLLVNVTADRDTTSMVYLIPAPGEPLRIGPRVLSARSRTVIPWRMMVRWEELTSTVTDTVRVAVRAAGWTSPRVCTQMVTLVPPRQGVSCALMVPPITVGGDGQSYAPDTAACEVRITNTGQTAARVRKTVITVAGDGVTPVTPLEIVEGDIGPGQTRTHRVLLVPRTASTARSCAVTASVRDSAETELTRCAGTLEIPGISPSLTCAVEAPDTLRYNPATDVHTPNPFVITVVTRNRVDTVLTDVEARLDLLGSPHLALATGEVARKPVGVLGAETRTSWQVDLVQPPETTTRVPVRVELIGPEPGSCTAEVVVEGRPRGLASSCASWTQDTVWADLGAERLYPERVEATLTLENTGNTELTGLRAWIVVPEGYRVQAGTDSVQDYGRLVPGERKTRSWSLDVDLTRITVGASELRWEWESAEQGRRSGCADTVWFVVGQMPGLLVSPRHLFFQAEQGGVLPPSQAVRVYGTGTWQGWSGASWLEVAPLTGTGTSSFQAGPVTTQLPEGLHTTTVDLRGSTYVRPSTLLVDYDIRRPVSASLPPSPATLDLGPAWPNPAREAVRVAFTVSDEGGVRLRLLDELGKERGVLLSDRRGPGRHEALLSLPRGLAAGPYLLVLETMRGMRTRRIMVGP